MLFLALLTALAPGADPPAPWREASALIERAVASRLFPGAVLVVGRRDTILFSRGYGKLSWDRGAPRPDPATTRWDLASLTKVVATTGAVMSLVDRGLLDLSTPVSRILPEFTGRDKDAVTVRMLLNHTSGLPAFVPFYRRASRREDVFEALLAVPLEARPGSRVVYSDLNALLLGLIVERLSGAPLDRFVDEAVFQPLGMGNTAFAVTDRTRVAPSIVLGGRAAPGVVSDPNARAMGGIAGHAGLFGTGLDLARYAQMWLAEGVSHGSTAPWVTAATVHSFLERTPDSGPRALGWDSPDLTDLERSAFGRKATATTYGHTGWTGTFLWFDPARDLFLVLLTNRSLGPNTTASFRAMRELRGRLSDVVSAAAGSGCGAPRVIATC